MVHGPIARRLRDNVTYFRKLTEWVYSVMSRLELTVTNLRTKFYASSCIRSKDEKGILI